MFHFVSVKHSPLSHNTKILKEHRMKSTNEETKKDKNCNCRGGLNNCPLKGECLTESVVYQAKLTASDGEVKTYTGLTERPFKTRLYGHRADRANRKQENATTMATFYWEKKDKGITIETTEWEILRKCHKYQPGGRNCDLCLTEKLLIMKNQDHMSLNKRSELMNSCRHRLKYKLSRVTSQ